MGQYSLICCENLMHPRNQNANGYDLAALSATSAALSKYLRPAPSGEPTIDFANPAAVKMLNRAILMHHYGVKGWDIPAGYLCPPIPGRADYIHTLADLLAEDNDGEIPLGPGIRGLDIGTGANLVYPLVAIAEYGWSCLGSEIDETALANAQRILEKNPEYGEYLKLRQQQPGNIFTSLLRNGENFAFSVCNPPFHASPDDVRTVARRKWNNLGKPGAANAPRPQLNFGGADHELWCEGGERAFIKTMIEQSAGIPRRVVWFTTLVAQADHLAPLEALLKKKKGLAEMRTLPMQQGQKQSRILAWSFFPARERSQRLRPVRP